MNHIYKSIFNKALGVFTAVPEFASAHGKGSERTVVGRVAKGTAGFAASALAISVGLALTSTSAVAAPGIFINNGQDPACLAVIDDVATSALQLIYGGSKTIYPAVGVAAGSPLGTKTNFELDARNPCLPTGGTGAENHDTQTNRTLFYNNKNLTLGGRLDVNSGIIGVGDRGTDGAGATNSIRMGTGTTLDEANKKINSIAIGVNTQATSHYATAIGEEALANGSDGALAIGRKATANATSGPMAIGYDAVTTGKSGIAQGYHAHTNAQSGLAIGDNAKASGIGQVAIGYASNAQKPDIDKTNTAAPNKADYSVTVGHYAGADYTGTNNIRSTLVGDSAGRYGEEGNQNTAVGSLAGMYVKGSNNVALGMAAGSGSATDKLEVSNTTAIGNAAKALTTNSISIGLNSKSGKADAFSGENSIAIGSIAEAMGTSSIAMGSHASTSNGHDSIALGTYATTENQKATAIGSYSAATGGQSLAIANNYDTNNLKPVSLASGTRATVIGAETTVSGNNSVAIGDTNTVASARTYVMGNNINAAAGTDDSLVFGTRAAVGGNNAIAMGNTATASAANAVAISNQAQAKTPYSVALGASAVAGDDSTGALNGGEAAIAIGRQAVANVYNGIAIGKQATIKKDSADGIAIGAETKVNAYKGAAIGAFSEANGSQALAIGNNKQGQSSVASGERSQVIGVESNVSGQDSTAIGYKNTVASNRTYAIGNNINAAAGTQDSLAFGTRASVGGASSIALGSNTKTYTDDSISIGSFSESGGPATTANLLGTKAIAIGYETKALATSAVALGYGATVENGHDSIAIGVKAKTSTQKSTTIGSYSEASGDQSTVIANNYDSKAGKAVSTASGTRSQVYGAETNVSGNNSVAIGDTNTVAGARTYAIGNNINVAAGVDDALAFGTRAAVGAENTVAIGANANAAQANSVALGAGSATSDVHTGDYTLNTSYTAAGLPNAANGTVSVGSAGKERQIQNVAAGVISATSTDAINGSQLYATNNYLSNLAGDVKNVLGGDAAVDNAGNLTMSNIGGTGKGNVHEAIAAVKGVADTAVQEVESENPTALSVKKDGTKVTLTPNFITGDLVNADGTVNAPATADEGKLVSAKTVADALKANHFVVDTKGNTETGSEADAKVGSGNKVTFEAGNNLVAKQANTANGGATVKFSLKDDISLNSVTAGTGANQVVLGNDGVKVGGNTYINNDGLNANSKVISNVADGVAPTDAVNKGQLDAVKNVADSAVQSVDVATNENNLVVDNNDPKNPKLRLRKAVDLDSIKLENNVGEKSFLNSAGLTIKDGPAVTRSGINANNTKVTNVTDGDVNSTSKDAVNGSQLYNVASNVADLVGPDAKIDPATGNVTVADPTKGIGETGKGTIGDAIKAVNKAATAAKTTVKEGDNITVTPTTNTDGSTTYTVATKKDLDVTSVTAGNTTVNTNGLTITGGPSVTRGGIDAGDRVISGVKAGDVSANSKEAVNGSQLYATNTKLDGVKAKADTAVQDVKSGDENALTAVKDPNTNIVTVTPKLSGDLVDADGNITAPTTPADKGKLVTAGTVAQALANTHFVVDTKATDGELDSTSQADQKIKAGNKVTLQAGKNLKAKQTNGADGAQVEFSLKDSISLTQVTAGEGDNQVVLGNDGVKVGGNTYINKDGLNANNKPISNVADGVKPTDAVNKGQLDAVKGVADSAVKSVDVANGEQNLVVDNTDPKNPKLSLKKDLTVDSVKAGDSTLNTDGLTIAGGPSVKKDGINAGNKKITGVADGNVAAGSTDAVNGGQLYNVANNVKDLIGPDATIDPATGKVTVADPAQGIAGTGKGTIGEAIKSVKDKADTAVQDIKSGDEKALSVTKAGNTYTITPNLSGDLVDADGNITAPATDADKGKLVTAGTVADALANTHFVVDTKATDGELDAASQADQKIKAGNKVTLQAGKNLKAKQTNGTNGAQVEFSLKDSISLTQVTAGTGDNQVVLGNDGVQVGGNTYINKDGLNANNKVISNVADGVNPNDAVNKGQLDAVKGVADSAVKSVDVVANENNLVVDNTDPKNPKLRLRKAVDLDSIKLENNVGEKSFLNSAGLTIKDGPAVTRSGINANNTKVTNVTDGDVNGTSKDAVNGSQLYNVASNVKDLIGPDAAIDPATGKVTVADPTKGIGGTGKGNIGDAIQSVKDAADKAAAEHTTVKAGNNIVVTEGTNAAGGKEYTVSTAKDLNVDSVKAGDTTVNNDGLTIAGGPSVKKDGIDAGDKNITNVADGNVAAGSKDAVNGGQLYDVAKNVADLVGPDATIDPATGKVTVADPTKGIGETGKGTIGDAIKAVNDLAKKAAAEKTSVKAKDGRSNVTVTEGTNAAGGHEYTVDVERAVTEAGSDQVTVTSKHDADSNTTTYTVDVSDKTKASLAKADSAVQGLTSKDGNLNFNKDPNGNVEVSFNDNLNVKNITADGVKAGDTTINSNGIEIVNGPSMTKDGINAGSKAITNVANGNLAKGSTDAVNGGQLHDTAQSVADVIGGGATVKDGKVVAGQNGIGNTGQNTVHGAIAAINQNTANNFNQIRGDLRKMDRDLRGSIAGTLATAGLPQAFSPGKSMVAAAAGTYRGQSGLAVGVSRISDNGKVILKVTGNTNSRGDFGGTIGAGYQW